MDIFLAIQHTYDGIEFALFRGQAILEQQALSKFHASAQLIPTLSAMLERHGITLSDLVFIAAHQGPGPFTTLRVVIATINGIAFAHNTPLVGVNGLEAFLREYADPLGKRTICMLNAFNHDVYYAYYDENHNLMTGAANGEQFLQNMATLWANQKLHFIGNAVATHRTAIESLFADRALIPALIPGTCSVDQIGLMGYAQWQRQDNVTHQLIPHYLKTQQFAKIG
jgi:tRNA threonylcarbamoyladenosine biosynthesis protein TsaB